MAYIRDMSQACRRCGKAATLRVMTFRNEAFGDYCRRCAPVVLRQVTADEQRMFESERRART
jgi:hypothetical protein